MTSKRELAALLLAGAFMLAAPAATLATGTLDQQVTTANNAHAVAGTLQPAQVFTAGITGRLDRLDLHLSTGFGPSGGIPGTLTDDLTVQIWTVTAGAPGSPISGASATVLRSAVPFGPAKWIQVSIDVPSVAGTQYAIVLSAPDATLGACPDTCWQWLTDDDNPYAGGPSYYRYCCGSWVAQGRDFNFKTYVVETVDVQIQVAGSGEGQVTSNPAGIECGDTCLAKFDVGSQLTLSAEPLSGGTFDQWEGASASLCTGQGDTCTFTVPVANVELLAVFTGITPPISQPPATPGPSTPNLTPPPSATIKPSTGPTVPGSTAGASTPAASVETSVAPSASLPGSASILPVVSPEASSVASEAPSAPAAASGGPPVLLIVLIAVAALLLGGGGWYVAMRRRRTV